MKSDWCLLTTQFVELIDLIRSRYKLPRMSLVNLSWADISEFDLFQGPFQSLLVSINLSFLRPKICPTNFSSFSSINGYSVCLIGARRKHFSTHALRSKQTKEIGEKFHRKSINQRFGQYRRIKKENEKKGHELS